MVAHYDGDCMEHLRIRKLFTPPSSMNVDSNEKTREIDDQNCYDEEVNDPRHVRFVEKMKEDGTSYVLQYEEEDGVLVKLKYEGNLSVDKECDVEPVRNLRSVTKNINKPLDQMFGVEDREMGKKQANKLKSKKGDNAKSSNIVFDPSYDELWKNMEISEHGTVCKLKGHEIWYEGGRKKNVEKKDNDGAFSDVEIIDSNTFYKERTSGMRRVSQKDEEDNSETESSSEDEEEISKMSHSVSEPRGATKFRRKVVTDLRKPYDKQEHDKLLQQFLWRRQEGRHLDLRNGRERSYSTIKEAKSYLDHYPVIGRKLALVEHDKLKCLNLLRGFFLYIQTSEPPFRPWEDEECCAITPMRSAMNRDGDYHYNPGSSKTGHHGFSL